MAFRIKHLDHVVLYVADLDRAIRFYCDVLGCTLERRVTAIDLVQLRAGASMIDLVPAKAGSDAGGRNMDNLALRIEPFDESSLLYWDGQGLDSSVKCNGFKRSAV